MKRATNHYCAITRACGHSEAMTLYGTDAEIAQQWASLKRTVCPACAAEEERQIEALRKVLAA